jgi:hypothetical protein
MIGLLEKAERKSFNKPDEVENFPQGKCEVIKIGGIEVLRATFEPGWKWSTSVQPLAKTKSCDAAHFCYHISGRLMVAMDDGTKMELAPGDVSMLPKGHDAWVIGNEAAVVVDFQGLAEHEKAQKNIKGKKSM